MGGAFDLRNLRTASDFSLTGAPLSPPRIWGSWGSISRLIVVLVAMSPVSCRSEATWRISSRADSVRSGAILTKRGFWSSIALISEMIFVRESLS